MGMLITNSPSTTLKLFGGLGKDSDRLPELRLGVPRPERPPIVRMGKETIGLSYSLPTVSNQVSISVRGA